MSYIAIICPPQLSIPGAQSELNSFKRIVPINSVRKKDKGYEITFLEELDKQYFYDFFTEARKRKLHINYFYIRVIGENIWIECRLVTYETGLTIYLEDYGKGNRLIGHFENI